MINLEWMALNNNSEKGMQTEWFIKRNMEK